MAMRAMDAKVDCDRRFCCGRKVIYPRARMSRHKEADYYEIGLVRSKSAQSHHIDGIVHNC